MKKLLALGVLILGISLVGCSKKGDVRPDDTSGSGDSSVSDSDIAGSTADSDSNNAMGLQTIRFPYDSFEIVGENREILKNNIKILKDNPGLSVQIEGHCDERGGIQYNLALGEKRANAVARQITAAGISQGRVTTLSLGKEKPIAMGSNEEAWAQNRRANFVITAK